ncbi:MAG: AzlD domain-containing protein [Burkholderiaceae bacterium]|nr:AzlD domain-containing protein [Burkholderiaceae bacterium]
MSLDPDVLVAILLMALATYLCRAGGFFLMRFVPITPRVEAGLRALPIALMGAILGPIAWNGGPAEWVGLLVAIVVMRLTKNEFIAVLLAIAAVAGIRAF